MFQKLFCGQRQHLHGSVHSFLSGDGDLYQIFSQFLLVPQTISVAASRPTYLDGKKTQNREHGMVLQGPAFASV